MIRMMKIQLNHVLIIVIIIMGSIMSCQHFDKQEALALLKSTNDSLQIYQNKYGEQVAKTSTIQGQNADLFLSLQNQDSITSSLQDLVVEYKTELKRRGSATVFESETILDTVQLTDTVWLADIDSGFILADSVHNNWITLDYGFKFSEGFTDSSYASLKIRNAYSLVIGEEKTGFLGLGKRKPFVEITNHNPYTQTKQLKTFEVTDGRKKHWVVGPQAGITIGEGFTLQPSIGIGVTYKLIEF